MPTAVRRLLVSHALASVAMSLPWPLLLVLVWDRVEGSARGDLLLGLTGAARMLPYVALSWASGTLADRFRRDRLLRATLAGRVVLLSVLAVAVWQDQLVVAVVAATLAVACGTPAYPALAAAMPALAGAARRRATDLLVTIEVSSFVVGPAVGGLLLGHATRGWVGLAAVVLTAAAWVLVVDVRIARPRVTGPVARTSPLAAVRASAVTRRAVAMAGLLNLVDAALLLGLLPLAGGYWSGGEAGYGPATAVLGFGALAAPLLWWLGRTATSRTRLGLLLFGLTIGLVPLAPALGWAVLPLAVAGAATVHVEGALTETIQDGVPDSARAGVLGLTDSVMVGAAMLGSLVAPWLAATIGARALLVVLAAVSLTGAAAYGAMRRRRPQAVRIPAQRGPREARPRDRSWSAAAPRG
jgi:MFS family permease